MNPRALRRRLLLFGGSGQIGAALQRSARTSMPGVFEIRTIPWDGVARMSAASVAAELWRCTEGWVEFDVVFANGITDSRESAANLQRSNVAFPLAVIEAFACRKDIRFLTFGTVLEQFRELARANEYVRSKRALGDALLGIAELVGERRALHLRLHTVYGGRPKNHMFLGQMIEALRARVEFRMSAGYQLREYHHVQDISGAVLGLLLREWAFTPASLTLSSGAPVRLAELAESVFEGCGCPELLKVGSVETPAGENCDSVFPRSDPSLLPYYREPRMGVLHYVRNCLGDPLAGAQ